ncbi:Protein DAMAGED DNA-BINDING 2 [Hordeum vulgare]|nr:Protein DAMAGED DNA-BINDING 2 [Hordeum vulgare]
MAVDGGLDRPAAGPQHGGKDQHTRRRPPTRRCYSMTGNWDYVKLHEKITYDYVHSCILNSMKFDTANDGVLYTASSDGTISSTDLDTRIGSPLLNLNPDGWSGPSTWRMIYEMDLNTEKGLLLVANSFGFLYL